MNCKQCNKELLGNIQKLFCSRSCSASFNNRRRVVSEEHKNNVRQTMLSKYNKKYCIICSKELYLQRHRKTCSEECLYKLKSTYPMPTPKILGGYRMHSGRGKHGWYNNVYFDSTWEIAYYIYCKDHNINIKRCNEKFEYINVDGKKRFYYPDFRVEGKLTEIKGYHTINVQQKINFIKEPIDVFYEKDLKDIFIYVETKTKLKIKDLYKLYDKKCTPDGVRSRKSSP